MNLKQIVKNRDNLSNIGVFMAFLTFSFLSFSLVSPIVSSNADTNNASVEAGPYTMSISTDSLTSINITPTASQAVYTGTSAISYTNTCPHGFNVTMSSASENTSLTRTGTDSGVKTIPTISTGTALTDNTWGFSKDNGSTYNAVPALANPATIVDTTSATTTAATLNLIYGVKTDNQLPSGSYSNDIVYTVSAKQQCLSYGITWDLDGGTAASGATYPSSQSFGSTLDLTSLTPTKEGYEFTGWSNGANTFDGTETAADINPGNSPSLTMTAQWEQVLPMQGFSCSTLTNVGDSVKLRDTRDNNVYTVKKLADGICWMTENLRIANKTITSADSNVTSDFTIPASSTTGFAVQDTNNAYVDSTYGGYYTFYTATAGTGGRSLATDGANAPSSICPKGWRLPTGGPSGEFQTLYNNYNSYALMQGEPNFTLSGRVRDNSIRFKGSTGDFWSSTVYDAYGAYHLFLDSSDSNVDPAGYFNKYNGYSVRCVVKEPTMQTFESSMLQNVGDSMQLEDERDGNKYAVKKLADGNVWMTDNLRIANKTITSADSNVTSDFTIPASSTSGFSAQNTNNAYVDSAYGGYYTFYTATAGTGGTSLTSGNAPSSICPKGWRLPTSGEFRTLYSNYNSASAMMGEPGFIHSGLVFNGSVYSQGDLGDYWSSTVKNTNVAYSLDLTNSVVDPERDLSNKPSGYSVRCIAEDRTINDITYMQDMTSKIAENTPINTVATLTDIRDNNTYTVRKLKDGNVWMTENLSLVNKTISSADSNLPSGESYTVPASNLSSFTSSYNTNSAYLDSTYGGYYNFYTATAGWGTNSVSSGNSPKDICPKGWRLPTGDSSGEYQTLYNKYNSFALMLGEPNFVISGNVYNGSVINQDSYGFFWSSTVNSANYAYNLSLYSSSVSPASNTYKSSGLSVRCMAV